MCFQTKIKTINIKKLPDLQLHSPVNIEQFASFMHVHCFSQPGPKKFGLQSMNRMIKTYINYHCIKEK